MMDFPLTLAAIFRRAERIFPRRTIVTRLRDKTLHRQTYADFTRRARHLASGLISLGMRQGDRVATLGWNHHQHLEAYFGVPLMGGVLHTLNLRLHPDELAYIVNDADDQAVLVDCELLPLWQKVAPSTRVRHVIVVGGDAGPFLEYESMLRGSEPLDDRPEQPAHA